MQSNFDASMAEVFRHEGGYANDPHDPGGETNMGISKRSYPNENIKGMTRDRAKAIYRRDFWNAVSGDSLPAGLDLVAFDPAVNSGVSRGAKWLQQALGVKADGKIGPNTIATAKAANAEAVIDRACDLRLAWLRTLPTWSRYGKGWTSRVESIRDVATAMSKTTTRPTQPTATPSPANASLIGLVLAVGAAAVYFLMR